MNMVERVATAISNAMAEHGATPIWSDRIARAAIEAMREPTQAMIDKGDDKVSPDVCGILTDEIYRAMIDTALKEGV